MNDSEVSIDPEMLGTIFENLLAEIDPDTEKSARKSTGSFYTPREIVDYMVEQSIVHYLKTKTSVKDENDLLTLFDVDAETNLNSKQNLEILEAISEIKILDPACGSGAFPMGALNKIIIILKKLDKGAVWWKQKQLAKANISNALLRKHFENKLNNSNPDYARKLGVIQHSIYGIDIQSIATEISKLRSFLSLIIDENIEDNHPDLNRGIEPLPNLEFKFVTANTLIGLDKGVNRGMQEIDFGESSKHQKDLANIRNDYLQASAVDKNQIKDRFQEIQHKIRSRKDFKNLSVRDVQLSTWNPFGNESSLWFDSKWMFGVEKFDIVIGNPPYGVSVKGDYRKSVLAHLPKVPDFEIYYFFIEIAKQFLKPNGVNVYIIPNTFLFNVFASDYRRKILESWEIFLIDCTAFKIFTGATVFNAITVFINKENQNLVKYKITKNATNFEELKANPNSTILKEDLLLNNQNWGLVFKLEQVVIDLVKKIKKHNNLSTFFDVTQGYIPYRKSDLIKNYGKKIGERIIKNREWHSPVKINDEYKEEIWGSSINKYGYKNTGSYIWYGKHLATYVDLKYFSNERLLIREITSPTIIACIVKEEFVNDPQLINVIVKEDSLSLKILWVILNSKLATFYHFNSSPKASKGAFPKILIYDINNFPIPQIPNENFFIEIVAKLFCTERNKENTSFLENQINIAVYKLYDLTHEEVRIIDPKFSLSQSKYDNFRIEEA